MNSLVIGFSGKIGTGKTTCARMLAQLLQEDTPPTRLVTVNAFGLTLKKEVSERYGIPLAWSTEAVPGGKLFELELTPLEGEVMAVRKVPGMACPFYAWPNELVAREWIEAGSVTVREILQWYGTEYARSLDPDYWVSAVHCHLEELAGDAGPERRCIMIMDDVRFPNELQWVNEFGACYRLEPYQGWKPGVNSDHVSETALDESADFEQRFPTKFGNLDFLAEQIYSTLKDSGRV